MEKYKKTRGSADMSGELYEVYVSMLLFLRSKIRAVNFKLGTNVSDIGAFDDIVLWYREKETLEEKWYFLQLKHKASKSIILSNLQKPDGDFSLIKYFASYLLVKRKFPTENSEFVIYTNAAMKSSKGMKLSNDVESSNGEESDTEDLIKSSGAIITFNDQSKPYKIFKKHETYRSVLLEILEGNFSCEEIKNKLMEFKELTPCKILIDLIKDKPKFKEEANKQCEEWTWNSWSEFMRNLKLYTEQPPLNKLEYLIKKIMEDFCGTSKMFFEFKENFTNWWRGKENYYLTENVAPFWEEIIKSQASFPMSCMHFKMEPLCGLVFQDSENTLYSGKATQIICEGCTELCCLRMQQSLKDDHLLIDIRTLRQNLQEVMFVWTHYQTLVVDASSDDSSQLSNDSIVKQITSIIESYPEKRIIFISSSIHDIAHQLPTEVHTDNFNLKQLSQESQQIVMKCLVQFQGQLVVLNKLLNDPKLVNADVTLALLRKEKIEIGIKLPTDSEIYIPRNYLRRDAVTKEFIKMVRDECMSTTPNALPV